MYALNKQAWNSALMYDQEGSQLPADGTCELDWEDQNRYQLYMMRDKRLEKGFEGAQELADKYMGMKLLCTRNYSDASDLQNIGYAK